MRKDINIIKVRIALFVPHAKPESCFLAKLSSPARNALMWEGIDTLQKLSIFTKNEILKIHGIGRASMPIMKDSLAEVGLSFKG